jgi:3-oxoacyl-[acyl-carrier protein] reductase
MVTTPPLVMSAGASGATAALKGLSVSLPFNVTVNNMLPERFDTDRQHRMAQATMK